MPIVKRLRRPCRRCSEMFVPSTRGTRLCDKCTGNIKRAWNKGKKKEPQRFINKQTQ